MFLPPTALARGIDLGQTSACIRMRRKRKANFGEKHQIDQVGVHTGSSGMSKGIDKSNTKSTLYKALGQSL